MLSDNFFYKFNNDHDPRILADHWFQYPQEGMTLFVIFYSQACRWSRCLGCNLPSQVSESHVSYKNIICQVDQIFHEILDAEQKQSLKKIILSNNGSILDQETFSTTALMYFLARMNMCCPNIKTLTIETRPEYVDFSEIEVISRAIREGDTETLLEIAIGFEAFDDGIRNVFFNKGMSLKVFEKMAKLLARYNIGLKTYFMLKPVPDISEEDAIADIHKAIEYLDHISRDYGLKINMHLNPTYVAKGTQLETAFVAGSYTPPELSSVIRAIKPAAGSNISVYVGLYDEGLAVEGGSFLRDKDRDLVALLEKFNSSQDFSIL